MVDHACNPSYGRKPKIRGSLSRPIGQKVRPSSPKLSEEIELEAWLKQ
jgi:hypothetical protein